MEVPPGSLTFNTAITNLRHLAGHAVNAAAYCRARMRLPLAALQSLLRSSSAAMRAAAAGGAAAADPARWRGLRTFLVDGSATIAPDTPSSQAAFGQPGNQKPGCGFPVPKKETAVLMLRALLEEASVLAAN